GIEAQLNERINSVEVKLTEKIDGIEAQLNERINGMEGKLSEKMDGIGKRLDNQEFISRGAIITLVGGVLTGLIKYLFFSDN
ncbi:hypothetical protein ACVWVQ_001827, partial [Thermostichus sp. MS-CIW-36]